MSLISFIESHIIDKDYVSKKSEVEELLYLTKIRVIIFCAILAFFTEVLLVVLRTYIFNAPFVISGLGVIASISILALTKFSKDLKVPIAAINIAFMLIVPWRVYEGGGIYAPAIYVYLFHSTIMLALVSKKKATAIIVWNIISIFCFAFFDTPSNLPDSKYYYALITIINILLVIIPVLFVIKGKEKLAETLKEKEKESSAGLVLDRVTHEVVNCLNIALGAIQVAKLKQKEGEYDPEKLYVQLETSLNRIDKIIKSMTKFADKKELVAKLEEIRHEVDITKL